MKSKMLIFIVMLAAGAMMLTACGEESKESSATQSTTQSATQTTTKSSSRTLQSPLNPSQITAARLPKKRKAARRRATKAPAMQIRRIQMIQIRAAAQISRVQRREKRNQVIPLRAARLRNPIRSRQSRSQSLPRTFPSFQPMNMSFRLFLRDK